MVIADIVRQRLGVFYSDAAKNAEIDQMIAGAKAFLINAGVPTSVFNAGEEAPEAIEAVVIYCKMAQNTDPVEMKLNPVLVAIVGQLRSPIPSEDSP